jgi:hypothetical protein
MYFSTYQLPLDAPWTMRFCHRQGVVPSVQFYHSRSGKSDHSQATTVLEFHSSPSSLFFYYPIETKAYAGLLQVMCPHGETHFCGVAILHPVLMGLIHG